MYPEDTGKLHYQVYFGFHNDDQKDFSLVKETRKSQSDESFANKVDETAKLPFLFQEVTIYLWK